MRNIVSLNEIRSFLRKDEKLRKLEIEYLRRDTVRVTYIIGAEIEILSTGPRTVLLGYRVGRFKRVLIGLFSGFIESRLEAQALHWNREEKQIEIYLDQIRQLEKFFGYAEIQELHIENEAVILDLMLL